MAVAIDPGTGSEVAQSVYNAYVATFSNPTPCFQAAGFRWLPSLWRATYSLLAG